ncbi:hypothetical protein H4219_001334 [Mycoemilia scoparia]|uniref:DUF221-domain-containing protein n=1 Tax=Mycoemilia scoparia TaxID=417184 RepID=A0A9W8A0M2_9FUNG|nr:hypothetical protein H4219_001334 [Mycoemilia scoparia]
MPTKPMKLPHTVLGWIWPVIKTPESYILHTLGLDAIIFLRFYRTCLYAFAAMSVYGLAVMIPVNWAWERDSHVKYSIFYLNITAQEISSKYIVAHIIAAYVNSIIAFFFLNRLSFQFLSLRWHFLIKARRSIVARTVMFDNLPSEIRGSKRLTRFATGLNIGQVERVRVIHKDDESLLPKALEKRSSALKKLEAAYCHILGNPCTAPDYNPELLYKTVMKKGPEARAREAELLKKWARTHKSYFGSKVINRPTMSKGFKKIRSLDSDSENSTPPKKSKNCFKKIDAIDYWRREFWYWDSQVKELREKGSRKAGPIGFVTFRSAEHAHTVVQSQANSNINVNVKLSVEPRAIYWPNITLSPERVYFRWVLSWIITAVLMIFWIVPVTLISALFNFRFWETKNPSLRKFAESHTIIRGFLTYTMPGVVLILFLNLLPWMLKWLAIFGGCRTRQSVDYTVLTRHFAFLIINVILLFTVSGTVINKIFDILQSPTTITQDLANTLPSVSTWFVGYCLLLGIGCQPFKLILLRPAIWHAFKAWFCKTPRDYANIVAPMYLDWGNLYPYPMLVFWIGMIYSAFSPIILPIVTAYYGLGFFVLKYQMLYVFFRDFESAGIIWPRLLLRLVLGILVYQVIMFVYLIETKMPYLSATLAPLVIYTMGYLWYRVRKIRKMGEFVPRHLYQEANESDVKEFEKKKGRKPFSSNVPDSPVYSPKLYRKESLPLKKSSNLGTNVSQLRQRHKASLGQPRSGYQRLGTSPLSDYKMENANGSTSSGSEESSSDVEESQVFDTSEANEMLTTAPASWLNPMVRLPQIPGITGKWLTNTNFGVSNIKRAFVAKSPSISVSPPPHSSDRQSYYQSPEMYPPVIFQQSWVGSEPALNSAGSVPRAVPIRRTPSEQTPQMELVAYSPKRVLSLPPAIPASVSTPNVASQPVFSSPTLLTTPPTPPLEPKQSTEKKPNVKFEESQSQYPPKLVARPSKHRRSPTPSHLLIKDKHNISIGKPHVSSIANRVLSTHKNAVKAQRRASKIIRKGVTQMLQGGVQDPSQPFFKQKNNDGYSSVDENFVFVGSSKSERLVPKPSFLGAGSINSQSSMSTNQDTRSLGKKPDTLRSLIHEMSVEDQKQSISPDEYLIPKWPKSPFQQKQPSSPLSKGFRKTQVSDSENSIFTSLGSIVHREESLNSLDQSSINSNSPQTPLNPVVNTTKFSPPRPPMLKDRLHLRKSSFASPLPRFVHNARNSFALSYKAKLKELANYQRYASEGQHTVAPDKFSDYSQSPMHKVDGVLDHSLCDYINPAMVGELPTLWLPAKLSPQDLETIKETPKK